MLAEKASELAERASDPAGMVSEPAGKLGSWEFTQIDSSQSIGTIFSDTLHNF